MDKYRRAAEKKLGDKVHPDIIAQEALEKAEFSSREREYFFNNAYGDLLVDYFVEWLKTAPHESKHREFIYNSALALGDVKARLIQAEQLGKNIPYIQDMEDNNETNRL